MPYHRNASKAGVGFDCSGLTAFAWGQSGVELAPRSSTNCATPRHARSTPPRPGDLVYYPGHVMMWLGVDNLIVHAPQPGHDVEVGHVTARRVQRVKFANPIG